MSQSNIPNSYRLSNDIFISSNKNDLNLKLNSYKISIYIIFALQQSRDCKDEKWEKSQFYTAHYKPRWFHFRLLETKVIPIYHPKGFYSLYNHAQAPSGRAAPPKTFFFLLYFFNFQMTIWTCENWLEQKKFTLFVTIDQAKTKDAGIRSD